MVPDSSTVLAMSTNCPGLHNAVCVLLLFLFLFFSSPGSCSLKFAEITLNYARGCPRCMRPLRVPQMSSGGGGGVLTVAEGRRPDSHLLSTCTSSAALHQSAAFSQTAAGNVMKWHSWGRGKKRAKITGHMLQGSFYCRVIVVYASLKLYVLFKYICVRVQERVCMYLLACLSCWHACMRVIWMYYGWWRTARDQLLLAPFRMFYFEIALNSIYLFIFNLNCLLDFIFIYLFRTWRKIRK